MRMKAKDLYRLRRLQLQAQGSWLASQFAQQRAQEFSLELERRYGLLAREATLDARTGMITFPPSGEGGALLERAQAEEAEEEEASYGPGHDAGEGAAGPARRGGPQLPVERRRGGQAHPTGGE